MLLCIIAMYTVPGQFIQDVVSEVTDTVGQVVAERSNLGRAVGGAS